MFNSSVILGEAADGYSSGQAMEIIEQIAREHLPENIGVEWSGLSFQEKQAGGQTGMVDVYKRQFCIYMNPLMIQGSICKKINSVLRHFHIVGNSNLPS